jgi:4-amino-4-deoxy-L-arabinose transferase-like glycosyltransferase
MESAPPPARPAAPLKLRWSHRCVVAAILLFHVGLAFWGVSRQGVTSDEILHLTGGYFYDRFGDYRIQPENGVLPQRWVALPAVMSGAPSPVLAGNLYWQKPDPSVIGHQLFYETGHDHWPMLMAGRAMMLFFSAGTGLLVFCWSRHLFGLQAGFFSLGLYALCPNILAHAPLATSDLTATFFMLATVSAFWRHLAAPGWANGALSALALGLTCVSKYSAVLLPPMLALLLAWRIARDSARARWWRIAPLTFVGHAVVAVAVIWSFYGFRYSAFAPGLPPADHFTKPWADVLPYIGVHGRLVEFFREWHLLPEAFLYGYSWVVQFAGARGAFLAGEYGIYGWFSFFPLAFLWKTPLAVLGATAAGLALLIRSWRRVPWDAIAPLLVLFVVYWAFSLTSHLNIGHRHILPTYPVLFIWLGALAVSPALRGAWRVALPVLVLAGQAAASFSVAPYFLPYFNRIAGGPAQGYRLLVDSSYDWGQGLPALADWLRSHNAGATAEPVYLSYFGSDEPDYYGLKCTRLPFINGFKFPHRWYETGPGLYCIGATMLQHVYSQVRGDWTPAREQAYQAGRAKEPLFREYFRNAQVRSELAALHQDAAFERTWLDYETLRFARLCHYLRARQPEAQPGYAMLVYRLDQQDLDAALNGTVSDLAAAIERAAHQTR